MADELLLTGFNEAQKDAVLYCDGPSLVVAGAGSGKTRVLTYKIAYLLSKGMAPWSILALTFTNKAANEMKRRISQLVGEEKARYLWMGTFHSVLLRILRTEHERIGFSPNFTIYDASDSKSLIKSIIKEMELDDKMYKPSTIAGRISMSKNQLSDAEDYYNNFRDYEEDLRANRPMTRDIYKRYAARCRQADAMDFDDILLYSYKLFAENPDVAAKYERQFDFVLVDEYQDTNYAQHRIVWLLSQHKQMVCVVGDDAQSIYSFRGARVDNILQFNQIYTNARTFKLEQNYRSTQMIVNAANSLIHKNQNQIYKNVFSKLDGGEQLQLMEVHSDTAEGDFVVRQLMSLRRTENLEYSDFAVLYRTNAQSRIFEEAFRKLSIPYRIYGGLSFYQRKEIKDVIAYFRMAVNPNDEEAFKRIVNYPTRGIGPTTVGKIIDCANQNETSLWSVLLEPAKYGLQITGAAATKLVAFREMIQEFIEMAQTQKADEVGKYIIKKSGITDDIYQDRTPENLSRQENVEEMINGMADFCQSRQEEDNQHIQLSDYLSEVSLLSDMDTDKGADESRVTLMTIHSAKGLEFNTVFVVGLEEGLFPNQMATGSQREIEEERRLFYVAITRAKCHCLISYSTCRYRYGKMEFSDASRFIKDIDKAFITTTSTSSRMSTVNSREPDLPWKRRTTTTRTSFQSTLEERESRYKRAEAHLEERFKRIVPSQNISQRGETSGPLPQKDGLSVGAKVEHDRFGTGVVEKIDGEGDGLKATVRFEIAGTKTLLLKYARIRVIG